MNRKIIKIISYLIPFKEVRKKFQEKYITNSFVFDFNPIIKLKRSISKKIIKKRYKKGEKIKVILQVSRPNMFCFEYLYKLLEKNPQFDTKIIIMPDMNYTKEQTLKYLDETYQELTKKGFDSIKGYDYEKDKPLDIRKKYNPDIIFYTDFWKPHFAKEFYIDNFRDKITLLTEYGYSVMQDELTCNFALNNYVDKYFRPSNIHLNIAKKLMYNKGANVIAFGSPKLDYRFDKNYHPKDIWKKQTYAKKRIIWAPHYNFNTLDNMYKNDGFWVLHDFMLEVAKKFEDKVQFVFRPHPVLYPTLVKEWGQEKTNQYYQKWEELENGQVFMGNFVDLFMTSDAMIMDCCSFMAEYTAFDKPLFHTVTNTSRTILNDFGEILYKNFYTPKNDLKEDIISFIKEVVIDGNDYKAEDRHKFIEQYFKKHNGKTASENIYNEMIKLLEE